MTRRILLTLLSAVLVILVFPSIGWWWLAPVAWVPFFMAIRETRGRVAFRLGVLHGFVSYGVTLSWMFSIFQTLAPALWLMLALFTGVFALAAQSAQRWRWSPAVLAILWTGIEYYRAELFVLDFPWITPGSGLPPNLLTPLIGVYGVSFLVSLAAALAMTRRWIPAATIGAGLLAVTLANRQAMTGSEVEVALIQNEEGYFGAHYAMSKEFVGMVDAIVWPEYAISGSPDEEAREMLSGITKVFVLGGLEEKDGLSYNTSFVEGPEGRYGSHVKNHTVHLFNDGERGTTAQPVETPLGAVGTPICFDCDYQDVIRKMTAAGAELFLIPSMDAMSWTARQHDQHAMLFRHRAAENSRWLAVASTSGKTQIIGPNGVTVAELPLMDEGTLTGKVDRRTERTLFQHGGWLIGPAMFGGACVLLMCFLVASFAGRRTVKPTDGGATDSF